MTVIVYHRHIAALRYCNRGARAFFDRHGIDWSGFLASGVPDHVLEATGDAMAMRAVERAQQEASSVTVR